MSERTEVADNAVLRAQCLREASPTLKLRRGLEELALESIEMWQEDLVFHSNLRLDAVLSTIRRTTDEESIALFSSSGLKGKLPFLSKVGGSEFQLRKRIFYRNSFARQLSARLNPDPEGTRIEARLAMSFLVPIFMTVWFAFVTMFEITAIVITVRAILTSGKQSSPDGMFLVVPTVMLIFGWLLVAFGLRLSRKGEREMIDYVEQTLVARRLHDIS